MPIPQKIIKFLEENKVKYESIEHRTVYTAFDKAATLRVKPNLIGKTLILKIDPTGKPSASYGASKDLGVVLIPGNKNLDKNKFKKAINDWYKKQERKPVKNIDFISERLMKNKFKGMKVGAIPPFGSLWKLPTFVDKGLMKSSKIIVNGGNYNWSVKINPTSLKRLIPDLVFGSFSKAK